MFLVPRLHNCQMWRRKRQDRKEPGRGRHHHAPRTTHSYCFSRHHHCHCCDFCINYKVGYPPTLRTERRCKLDRGRKLLKHLASNRALFGIRELPCSIVGNSTAPLYLACTGRWHASNRHASNINASKSAAEAWNAGPKKENCRLIHHRKTGASLAKHASAWWRRQGRGNCRHRRDGQHSDVVVGICTLASTPGGLMRSCQLL